MIHAMVRTLPTVTQRRTPVLTGILLLSVLLFLSACSSCEHEWLEASCGAPEQCKLCLETRGEVLVHSWTQENCVTPAVCSLCNQMGSPALGHSFSQADCTNPGVCERCGEKTAVLGHEIQKESIQETQSLISGIRQWSAPCGRGCGETVILYEEPMQTLVNEDGTWHLTLPMIEERVKWLFEDRQWPGAEAMFYNCYDESTTAVCYISLTGIYWSQTVMIEEGKSTIMTSEEMWKDPEDARVTVIATELKDYTGQGSQGMITMLSVFMQVVDPLMTQQDAEAAAKLLMTMKNNSFVEIHDVYYMILEYEGLTEVQARLELPDWA